MAGGVDDIENYQCAISGAIFLEPVKTNCDHVFESEELKKWDDKTTSQAKKKAEQEGRAVRADDKDFTCPECRTKIISQEPAREMKSAVKKFLEQDPDLLSDVYVSAARRKKLDKLCELITQGKTEAAIAMLNTADYLRYAVFLNGQTALHLFAAKGNLQGVKAVVELGTNLNKIDGNNKTALMLASELDDLSCYHYLNSLAIDKDNEIQALAPIEAGINAYLAWRREHAPGTRINRLMQGHEMHWHHGQSGEERAERLLKQITSLKGNWHDTHFRKYTRDFKQVMLQSSHTEHALKRFIERVQAPNEAKFAALVDIYQGIDDYIKWSQANTQGIRGVTRFSHLRHGQSGLDRALDLQKRIAALQDNWNVYDYQQFEAAYKKALAQSSKTQHSLYAFIDNALPNAQKISRSK